MRWDVGQRVLMQILHVWHKPRKKMSLQSSKENAPLLWIHYYSLLHSSRLKNWKKLLKKKGHTQQWQWICLLAVLLGGRGQPCVVVFSQFPIPKKMAQKEQSNSFVAFDFSMSENISSNGNTTRFFCELSRHHHLLPLVTSQPSGDRFTKTPRQQQQRRDPKLF